MIQHTHFSTRNWTRYEPYAARTTIRSTSLTPESALAWLNTYTEATTMNQAYLCLDVRSVGCTLKFHSLANKLKWWWIQYLHIYNSMVCTWSSGKSVEILPLGTRFSSVVDAWKNTVHRIRPSNIDKSDDGTATSNNNQHPRPGRATTTTGPNNKHQHYADPREFGIKRKKWPMKQPTRRPIDRSSSTPRIKRRFALRLPNTRKYEPSHRLAKHSSPVAWQQHISSSDQRISSHSSTQTSAQSNNTFSAFAGFSWRIGTISSSRPQRLDLQHRNIRNEEEQRNRSEEEEQKNKQPASSYYTSSNEQKR